MHCPPIWLGQWEILRASAASVASGTTDTDAYLESLGVSNLRYDNSSWCREGSSEVKIVVDYDIKSSFPFFDLPPRHYRVCASTRVWSGA